MSNNNDDIILQFIAQNEVQQNEIEVLKIEKTHMENLYNDIIQ